MQDDPEANEQLLLLHEQQAMLLNLIHSIDVVCLIPGSDRLRLQRLSESMRANLAKIGARRRALQSASID